MPENPPVNVTAVLNGTEVLMTWEMPPGKLNGELQGYVVEYSTASAQQVSLGFIVASDFFVNLTNAKKSFAFYTDELKFL